VIALLTATTLPPEAIAQEELFNYRNNTGFIVPRCKCQVNNQGKLQLPLEEEKGSPMNLRGAIGLFVFIDCWL